ncbi:MAG: potassium-transporting ATPase subunit B, partial [Rhodomicrobium sp.]
MLAPATTAKSRRTPTATITDPKILIPAIAESFKKLNPLTLAKNPVMFVVEVVAALVTVLFIRDLIMGGQNYGFSIQIILWLWFTVLFANFAEAVAEGRGKAQAASLRATKTDISAKKLADAKNRQRYALVPAMQLKPGDVVFVEAGDLIPSDGDVIEGVASVNEAAITGESAPVIRESGGDR